MPESSSRLRVALLAGSLGQGGAEKQLIYAVRAFLELGATVRVYSLTEGEYYERVLQELGIQPVWIGRQSSSILRLAHLTCSLIEFQPHILQSAHFFANLYATVAAKPCRAISVGSIRCDVSHGMTENGRWGRALLVSPPSLVANSYAGKRNAEALGVDPRKIHVLPNVIDLAGFGRESSDRVAGFEANQGDTVVAAIGSLIQAKRLDRFLIALARAREHVPELKGLIVGDGPERENLEKLAGELRLVPDGLRFAGRRSDVPALLRTVSMFALTSDHEGFPNVLLEAMASRLPVVATAVGDVSAVVDHGVTGFVVSTEDPQELAARMVELANSLDLCKRLGQAGREKLEREYGFERLPQRLQQTYHAIAEQQNNHRTLDSLG